MTEYLRRKIRAAIMSGGFRGYLRSVTGYPVTLTDSISLKCLTVVGNSVQDGTPTVDAPIEIQSCGDYVEDGKYQIPITVSGTNLFDVNDKASSFTVDEDGWITMSNDNSSGTSTKYFSAYTNKSERLKTDTVYAIVFEIKELSGFSITRVSAYEDETSKGQFLTSLTSPASTGIFVNSCTTRSDFSDAKTMLRTQLVLPAGKTGKAIFRISVLEDTSVTADTFKYEPYYEPVVYGMYASEPIRGAGDAADSIRLSSPGKSAILTQEFGVMQFDGSEGWSSTTAASDALRYQLLLSGSAKCDASAAVAICSHLPLGGSGDTWSKNNLFTINNYLYVRTDGIQTLAEFKAWLAAQAEAGTPFTVVYRRAESITEDISDLQDWDNVPQLAEGTNVITVETTIAPSSITAEYYSKIKQEE